MGTSDYEELRRFNLKDNQAIVSYKRIPHSFNVIEQNNSYDAVEKLMRNGLLNYFASDNLKLRHYKFTLKYYIFVD